MKRSWSTSIGPCGSLIRPNPSLAKPLARHFRATAGKKFVLAVDQLLRRPPACAAIELVDHGPALHQVDACAHHDEDLTVHVGSRVTCKETHEGRDVFGVVVGTRHEFR